MQKSIGSMSLGQAGAEDNGEPTGFRCKLRVLGTHENTLGEKRRLFILYTAGVCQNWIIFSGKLIGNVYQCLKQ